MKGWTHKLYLVSAWTGLHERGNPSQERPSRAGGSICWRYQNLSLAPAGFGMMVLAHCEGVHVGHLWPTYRLFLQPIEYRSSH